MQKKLAGILFLMFCFVSSAGFASPSNWESSKKLIDRMLGVKTYRSIQIVDDLGYDFELRQKKGSVSYIKEGDGSVRKKLLDKNVVRGISKGYGVDARYAIGMGLYDDISYLKKYLVAYGLFGGVKYVYGQSSSFAVIYAGVDLHVFWLLNLSCGFGYSVFGSKKLNPSGEYDDGTDTAPLYSKKNNNGLCRILRVGLNIPFSDRFDGIIALDIHTFNLLEKKSKTALWERDSVCFGLAYKM